MPWKEIISLMPWIIILILGLAYFKPITALLQRLDKAKISKGGLELEAQEQLGKIADKGQEITQVLKDLTKQIEKIAQQEKPYSDYSDALKDAEKHIIDCLHENAIKKQSSQEYDHINIKIIAVAMTFSWRFICDRIPRIIKKYPTSYINVELVFVEHEYLESLNLEDYDINWAKESEKRITEIQTFTNGLPDNLREHISISGKVYKNLPHWHGFLVDDNFLFLGRTDWSFLGDKPKLSVGQNKYRYFDRSSSAGIERIDLFKRWHKYYFNFASEDFILTE